MRIEEIVEELTDVDDQTRLELLLEYADILPPLPQAYHALRDAGIGLIHECQSPVFLLVEVRSGKVRLVADVPREAPTPRSFLGILYEAFNGRPTGDLLAAPEDLLNKLGLTCLLGMQRIRGLSAIYRFTRGEVIRQVTDRVPLTADR